MRVCRVASQRRQSEVAAVSNIPDEGCGKDFPNGAFNPDFAVLRIKNNTVNKG
jgi:hypothetical protein